MILGFIGFLPIVIILVQMLLIKTTAKTASMWAFISTIILAIIVWKLSIKDAFFACIEGVIMALWPIGIVVIAAMFLFNICNNTGCINLIRDSINKLTNERCLIVLFVVFGIGSIVEGIAGFGVSIVVSSSILYLLGFSALFSVFISIIVNPISSVFGSLGVQMPTLASVTDLPADELAKCSMLIVIPLILITPFFIIYETKKRYNDEKLSKFSIFLALLSGVTFSIVLYLTVVYVSYDVSGLLAAIFTTIIMIVCFSIKNKKWITSCFSFECLRAWSPFILCVFFLIFTSKINFPLHRFLSRFVISIPIQVGGANHKQDIYFLSTAAIWIFLAAIVGGKIQKADVSTIISSFYQSIKKTHDTIIVLVLLISVARVMHYSGMIRNMSDLIVSFFGHNYMYVIPFMGSLGAFVTGSATSANVLLGNLQTSVAESLKENPIIAMGFSIVGGTIGKMISPQNITLGLSTVSLKNKDYEIFRKVLEYYWIYLIEITMFAFLFFK